jgi:hypothetical protein
MCPPQKVDSYIARDSLLFRESSAFLGCHQILHLGNARFKVS